MKLAMYFSFSMENSPYGSGNFVALSCNHDLYVQIFFFDFIYTISHHVKFKIGVIYVTFVFEMCVIRIFVGRLY
jgi:hypothetical protein